MPGPRVTNIDEAAAAMGFDLDEPEQPFLGNGQHRQHTGNGAFSVADCLSRNGIAVKTSGPYKGGTRFVLECCPFDSSHKAPDAVAYQGADGIPGFKCSHSSCAGYHWKEFRARIEPEYANRQQSGWNANRGQQQGQEQPKPEPMAFKLVDADELFTTEYEIEWLAKGLLVRNQPGLICGPKKALKTTIGEEIAISLATGCDVLGNPKWHVPERLRVLFFSAESGDATIAETAKRIAKTKGFDHLVGPSSEFSDDPPVPGLKGWLTHCWNVPLLNSPDHVEGLRVAIQQTGAKVVILDPAYLMFAGADPKSLFDMGARLRILNDICSEMMVTILLVHHFKKGRTESDSPQLEDVAFAGFQEWARQWLMLDRENEYVPGSGHHDLILSWGGSVGHSGQVSLIVDEGVNDGHGSQRIWQTEVIDRQAKQARKADAKNKATQAATDAATENINAAFRAAAGKDLTLPDLARAAGLDQRNKAFLAALGAMIRTKQVEEVEFTKSNKQTYSGFRRHWKNGEDKAA